jgi:hypothetical protein
MITGIVVYPSVNNFATFTFIDKIKTFSVQETIPAIINSDPGSMEHGLISTGVGQYTH